LILIMTVWGGASPGSEASDVADLDLVVGDAVQDPVAPDAEPAQPGCAEGERLCGLGIMGSRSTASKIERTPSGSSRRKAAAWLIARSSKATLRVTQPDPAGA
jgi:hypothetical protein